MQAAGYLLRILQNNVLAWCLLLLGDSWIKEVRASVVYTHRGNEQDNSLILEVRGMLFTTFVM